MTLAFGTDGIRGDTRRELTGEAVEALGRTAADVLGAERFAVGRDTRISGPGLVEALSRGVRQVGGSAVDLGVVPTPAVARWCQDERVAGAMVSASHNPWHDNGVKLFASGGRKLSDGAQHEIERRVAELLGGAPPASGDDLGTGHDSGGAQPDLALGRHIGAVAASLEGRDLTGLRIVVDAANGAVFRSAPECLRRLGADVETVHAAPDGYNINDGCGSLHPESLQAEVVSSGAHAGLAFDGDADRVLAVDDRGALVDGDQILAVCAIDRAGRGRLTGSAVVVTVMANLGLRQAMAAHGINVVETPVGDRHVLGALEDHGLVLGGEQSGHLIFRDLATTGDGLLTAVHLLDAVKRSGSSLRDLAAAAMTRLPQVLVGVPMPASARPADLDEALGAIASEAMARLGDSGRVLVRPSGTEPLVRVMVEAADTGTAQAEADRLAARIEAVLA
ncbi:MAG: phosphoglucosamine mutase [Acidimicrobiaceae bacterium]|nr:phosphoglucosamine mutase [Acidimicrobiaceae bacterium]MYH00847.1 phosphoglucosamine mutase [Acidimicrobiaceae bacterium]MYL03263.1 phosphoglucosamine mutase [Acidimicrobiaceae bacterium]